MSNIIKDGTGSGNTLRVNQYNQAETFSEIRTEIATVSLRDEQAFVVATGFISITTTASFSGVLYIKNTDSQGRNIFIEHIRACGSSATMGAMQVKIIKNPTTGTLISNAVDAYTENNNFGSANDFNGDAYKGADANTVTDGDWFTQFVTHLSGHSIQDYNDSIVIPKNKSLAIMVKPDVAAEICLEINLHFK